MHADLPSPPITFLFTDIEGSTQLWERQPEAMQAALARHDRLLREAIEAHHGRIIKSTGDGCHAAFEAPRQACAAVLAAQRALCLDPWPELQPQRLRVRMALHTGEAEERAGDYFGPAVNRAARLLAIGHGEQILLSAVTADLARDQLPPGTSLLDLGQHQLKDLIRPEQVFQLAGSGLPDSFPALRSLGTLPHNLPVQLTSFVGREQELAEVRRRLAATRLLTLTGPGGTGKTRLALQAAAEALDTFHHGAWLVELASLTDPALVTQAVAAVLGVREQPGRPLLETLSDYLRPKSLLLVLDNCEHLIAGSAQTAEHLLHACAHLKILATSREVLGLAGEAAYRVPSLGLADARSASPDALTQSESVRLFVDRAQAVQPRFVLAAHNLRAVAQICERLDGIPLAIELAAARIKVFSAEQIASRLDDRFRLLTGGSRTALERHQTLRALIDWSCDLLSPAERAAWRQLSVFAGGFSFEAAEAVLGTEALEWLSHLVDKSLVLAEEHPATGAVRYRLLETIRQYGRDGLLEAGEAAAARDRHLAHYRELALEAEPFLTGPQTVPTLNRLELELDNVRAALEWALGRDPATALEVAASLKYFWLRRSHVNEGRHWLRECLPRAGAEAAPALRAKGLLALGSIAVAQGDQGTARDYLVESAALARTGAVTQVHGLSLTMLALVLNWLGDEAALEAALAEAHALVPNPDPEVAAMLLSVQSQRAAQRQDYGSARAAAETALTISRQAGNPWQIAITLMGLAAAKALTGSADEARAHLVEAEDLFRTIGDRHMAVSMRSQRAHLERQEGRYPLAASLYAESILAFQEEGERPAVLHDLECMAFIAADLGQATRAARLLGAAEALREQASTPMTSLERNEYDAQVARLRAAAEPAGLAAAWAEGRALSLDEAVAFALA